MFDPSAFRYYAAASREVPLVNYPEIDYRGHIQEYFYIKTKHGEIIRFIFNDVQNGWYDNLYETYGATFQGVRENDLKGRQFGISTGIEGIFGTDFILSATGQIPLTDSVIYSHKDKETTAHFNRISMFLDSYLITVNGGDYTDPSHRLEAPRIRSQFLKIDTTNLLVAKNGAQIETATAGAKVSGRGSTKQNVHWSEVAFYPNTPILSAEALVTGAEEQVPEGYGKIFRETTGNMMGDYFSKEYYAGKEGRSEFHSRFMAWYLHKEYRREAPEGWMPPLYYAQLLSDGLATLDQCFWHYMKTRQLEDKKKLREYPTYDYEAFLFSGTGFFDPDALLFHNGNVRKPIKSTEYVEALV